MKPLEALMRIKPKSVLRCGETMSVSSTSENFSKLTPLQKMMKSYSLTQRIMLFFHKTFNLSNKLSSEISISSNKRLRIIGSTIWSPVSKIFIKKE